MISINWVTLLRGPKMDQTIKVNQEKHQKNEMKAI